MTSETRVPADRRSRRLGEAAPSLDALDEAFAAPDVVAPREGEDLSAAIRTRIAALDEQNRELTRLLERLESTRASASD